MRHIKPLTIEAFVARFDFSVAREATRFEFVERYREVDPDALREDIRAAFAKDSVEGYREAAALALLIYLEGQGITSEEFPSEVVLREELRDVLHDFGAPGHGIDKDGLDMGINEAGQSSEGHLRIAVLSLLVGWVLTGEMF